MISYIIGGVILLLLVLWFISIRRTLTMLGENINYAMSQIGTQISSRWDALSVLLDLIEGYTDYEYKALSETMMVRRLINAESSAKDAAAQDNLLIQAMRRVRAVAEQYPALRADADYQKAIDSVNRYEGMVRQSRLIYNDSVTRLNRQIRMFPTSIVAGMLDFSPHDYLEAQEGKADMTSIE